MKVFINNSLCDYGLEATKLWHLTVQKEHRLWHSSTPNLFKRQTQAIFMARFNYEHSSHSNIPPANAPQPSAPPTGTRTPSASTSPTQTKAWYALSDASQESMEPTYPPVTTVQQVPMELRRAKFWSQKRVQAVLLGDTTPPQVKPPACWFVPAEGMEMSQELLL